MGHKKKKAKDNVLSSSSEDEDSDLSSQFSSDSQSSSSESERPPIETIKLSKKDLKKLILLEKKIEKEEELLKKKVKNKKGKEPRKSELKKHEGIIPINNNSLDLGEGKKLFITAIPTKYSHQEVEIELMNVLKNVDGATGLRIKRKQGCATYAFIDFKTKQQAKVALEKLKKKRIFGEYIAIYYSQDEKNNKGKKCFQCRQHGHFARECQNKKKNQLSSEYLNQPEQKQTELSPQPQPKQEAVVCKREPEQQPESQQEDLETYQKEVKIQEQEEKANKDEEKANKDEDIVPNLKIKRTVRDKSRSSWLKIKTQSPH